LAEKANNSNSTASKAGETGVPSNPAPEVGAPKDPPQINPAPANPAPTNAVETVTPPVKKEESKSENTWGWEIFWIALVLAIFVWMWRTGKLLKIKTYVGETKEELGKCTWPTWGELKQHIVVVLISSVLLAMFTVLADNVVREIVWGALLDSKTIFFKGSGE